jgi:putative ATP-dependent endonuclease of OLD family
MKAPDNRVLQFVLSPRVILVEGDAEFLLIDALYKNQPPRCSMDKDGVHLISVGGTSFKHYLALAGILGIRTAVVRDNDGDYQKNCIERYASYRNGHIEIFSDKNPARRTFEICVYQDNQGVCDGLFQQDRVSLTVQEYMLASKTEAAFRLLDERAADLVTPRYIQEAIEWIRK